MSNLVVEVVDPELEEGECGKDGWTKSDHEKSIPVANVTKLFTAVIYKWLEFCLWQAHLTYSNEGNVITFRCLL
jgi:hypothetical protein